MSTQLYHTPTTKSNTLPDTRHERARALLASGAVHPVADRRVTFAAWVESQARPGIFYYVTLGPESCECYDHRHSHNGGLCKHILAARYTFVRLFEQGAIQ